MGLKFVDRVKESTTTTGTGTVNLAGAQSGYQGFVAGIGSGNACYYVIAAGTEWEVGLGTVTDAAPDTLSRDAVFASSNAGAKVNFSAGSKDVFLTLPAAGLLPRSYLAGLQLANNGTDATNDIDIAVGAARDSS